MKSFIEKLVTAFAKLSALGDQPSHPDMQARRRRGRGRRHRRR